MRFTIIVVSSEDTSFNESYTKYRKMLRQLFSKNTYNQIDQQLKQVYQTLGIPESKLKVKKQAATYFSPYSYVVEGEVDSRRFVLSLHSSELKTDAPKQQLEFTIQCENPNWVVFKLHSKNIASSIRNLAAEQIDLTKHNELKNIAVECSNKELAKKILNPQACKKIAQLTKEQTPDIQIERKRLYYKTDWLPDNPNRQQLLLNAIKLGLFLVTQIDQPVSV